MAAAVRFEGAGRGFLRRVSQAGWAGGGGSIRNLRTYCAAGARGSCMMQGRPTRGVFRGAAPAGLRAAAGGPGWRPPPPRARWQPHRVEQLAGLVKICQPLPLGRRHGGWLLKRRLPLSVTRIRRGLGRLCRGPGGMGGEARPRPPRLTDPAPMWRRAGHRGGAAHAPQGHATAMYMPLVGAWRREAPLNLAAWGLGGAGRSRPGGARQNGIALIVGL